MILTYRKATLADVPQLEAFAVEYARKMYPKQIPDKEKIHRMAIECVSSASNYAWVASDGGTLKAVICVLVHEAMWAERQLANVLLWVSKVPRAGAKLLKGFLAWVSTRRIVRFTGVAPTDERVALMLQRKFQFQFLGGSLIRYN